MFEWNENRMLRVEWGSIGQVLGESENVDSASAYR